MRPPLNSGTLGRPKAESMSKGAAVVALTHDVVLERSASATYVARRDSRSLFIAGPNFTDAAPSRFRRVVIGAALELDQSLAEVVGLSVGSCAFRQDRSDPWTHGTIPSGLTFLIRFEVCPNESNLEAVGLGGAFVNCWIWRRARGLALHQAAITIPYYAKTNPRFASLAQRTVQQVLLEVAECR